jgi:hypothetical protein
MSFDPSVIEGMLEANTIAAAFPAVVTSFLANPLLGVVQVAEKAASAVIKAMGAIKDTFLDVARAADNLGESAEKAGVTVEFLSGIGYAAKDSGASVEALADAMKFLNKNASDANIGEEGPVKAFALLGVSVQDATGKLKNGENLFYDVADAISSLGNDADKTAAAMALLGRGGTDLIPTLNMGATGIRQMQEEAKALGAVMTTSLAAAGDKWGKLETTATMAWDGIKNTLAKPVLEFVADNFNQIKGVIVDTAGAIRQSLESIDWQSLLKDGLDLFKHLGETIRGIDWGNAVQGILTIADAMAKTLEVVLKLVEEVGALNSGIKSISGGSTSLLGLISPAADAVTSGIWGGSKSTPAPAIGGGKGTTTIQSLNIQVEGIDVNEASSAIANKIHGPLREQLQRHKQQFDGEMSKNFVVRAL